MDGRETQMGRQLGLQRLRANLRIEIKLPGTQVPPMERYDTILI